MWLVHVIVVITLLVLIIHLILNANAKRFNTEVEIQKELEKVINEQNLKVSLNIKEKTKPNFNYLDMSINISEGTTTKHVAEAFHELGHAIDSKDYDPYTKHATLKTILFYVLKYSIPLSIFLYVLETSIADLRILIVPTFIFIFASIWFFAGTLHEEIKATKYGMKIIKDNLNLNTKETNVIKLTMFNGLLSYITLFLLSLIVLIGQIIYTLN